MDKFVKDQLEMSGHISQDLETDKRKNETGDRVISNEMAQKVSHRISDQAENEKIGSSDAGSLDQEQDQDTETTGSTNKFKAIGVKLEKAQKKVTSSGHGSGILGWIGGLFGGSKKVNIATPFKLKSYGVVRDGALCKILFKFNKIIQTRIKAFRHTKYKLTLHKFSFHFIK